MWHRLEGEERLELKKKKIPIPIYVSTHVQKLAGQTFKRDTADIIASQMESSTYIFESWKTANRQQHGSDGISIVSHVQGQRNQNYLPGWIKFHKRSFFFRTSREDIPSIHAFPTVLCTFRKIDSSPHFVGS